MNRNIDLVKAAQKGDTHAFAQLYEEIYKDLYRFALYTLRNSADAEDAVSDAVTDAFASMEKLRHAEAFRSWMFRILSNKCKNRMKEYARKTVDLEDVGEEMSYVEDVSESLFVRRAFMELEDTERMIISMRVFGGYTSREISGILSMNANTVRTRESRALKKLAARLGDGQRG